MTHTELVSGTIHVIDGAFTNGDEVINILEASAGWDAAQVQEPDGTHKVAPPIRNNMVASIDPYDFRVDLRLYEFVRTVWGYIHSYAVHHSVTFIGMENVVVNRYEVGDRYLPHVDSCLETPRVISAVAYLNDVDGGDTHFTTFDLKVQPKAGRLVIFPSNYAYRHAALPPISGRKYAAAFWTRGA